MYEKPTMQLLGNDPIEALRMQLENTIIRIERLESDARTTIYQMLRIGTHALERMAEMK